VTIYCLVENNLVTNSVVVEQGNESEDLLWLEENLGGNWVPAIRALGKPGGRGDTYHKTLDAFIPPKPFDSWVLDEATCLWVAPVEHPEDGGEYTWDEATTSWVQVDEVV